jgi:Icc-related predicted phosphoesterase
MRPKAQDADSRALRKRYIKFCQEELSKYKTVLLVMGNHEYYGGIFEDTANILCEFLSKHASHAILLDNETYEMEGVLFIGSTLWATYGASGPFHVVIQKGMNDFHCIRTRKRLYDEDIPIPSKGRTLIVPDIYNQFMISEAFIRRKLSQNNKKPMVVITHHAPSYFCLAELFDNFNDAYASNQHMLIDSFPPVMWTYGHTHNSKRVRINNTLIVSNQRGYFDFERCARFFDPSAADFTLEEIKERKLFDEKIDAY